MALAALFAQCAKAPQVAESPNVLVILADDQGYGDLSLHGNPVIQTPNLDKLAEEAVSLTDFHVAPMSSPTRGQLMTGWDAMRNGCTAVCRGRSLPNEELPMMPEFFQEAGYATGHFGKWHMGDSYPYRPTDRGFDVTLHIPAWGVTSLADSWMNSNINPKLRRGEEVEQFEGYTTDIFFDEAMAWMKECQQSGKPSFTYLALNAAHVPEIVEEEYSDPYYAVGEYEDNKVPADFYGMIANIDYNLERLDAFLEANGLKENTIVIYTSDNGTQNTEAYNLYNAGMRDKKCSVFEGGHRVPCFIRWPEGGLQHGSKIDQMTVVQDILPTLAEMCALNGGVAPKTDGVSLKKILTQKGAQLKDRMKVVQYNPVNDKKWSNAVVLWDKWRLVENGGLYDVESDPHQDNDLADQYPEIAVKMSEYYDSWYADTKELYDAPRFFTIGAEESNPMMLYANDWNGGYCDNKAGLFAAKQTGYYNVKVAQAGEYEIMISRWPLDAYIALCSYSEEFDNPSDNLYKKPVDPKKAAKPIAKARLMVGNGIDKTINTKKEDRVATFTVQLEAGETTLETQFLDKNGKTICGGIYTTITRK